jgi:hypothetical protein
MKKLEMKKMEGIQGGKQDYCSTLAMITQNNTIGGGAMQGAMSGFYAGGCADKGYDFVVFPGGAGGSNTILVYKAEN